MKCKGKNKMKAKVYRATKSLSEVFDFLKEKNYEKIGKTRVFKEEQVNMSLFFDVHSKKLPSWINEILLFFKPSIELDVDKKQPDQHNAIVVVETKTSLFLLPKGQAFWAVDGISDPEFGLDFAEKTIKTSDVNIKSVSYIQRNKMREITNYKKNKNEFPQASESYFYVSGKPESENFFGTTIDCGQAITFSKNYNLSDIKEVQNFCKLFNEIDNAFELKKKKSSIPRLHKIPKKDSQYKKLNIKMAEDLKNSDKQSRILININRIQMMNDNINILENEQRLGIYCKGDKTKSEEIIVLSDSAIINYIKKHSDKINSIDQIMFALYDEEDKCIDKDISFLKLMYSEIEDDERIYVLDNGTWGYFNERFFELLEEKITEINKVVKFRDDFNIEYESQQKGELAGEGGYIEPLTQEEGLTKLHKRNLSILKSTIEIADIYDTNNDELYAIKRGTDASLAMYSFEQSLLSTQVLSNRKEFNVRKELLKYNNRDIYKCSKKYPTISDGTVGKIVDCKNVAVLWLVGDKPKYIFEGVKSKKI